MKNGLASWHYPHRTVLENVEYFAKCGFESISLHGDHMFSVCKDKAMGEELARLVKQYDLVLTVHHKLPPTHAADDVADFKEFISVVSKWQEQYGGIAVLSFDALVRDHVSQYIDYVLSHICGCKVAIEDFGLTAEERAQIEYLKGEERFGYLLDIGHLYIRMRGQSAKKMTLFDNSPEECPITESPTQKDFLAAFRSKTFPIFEIHLHNNDGVNDMHYFLEDGTIKIEDVAAALKEFGFDGVLTIESAPGFVFHCVYPESDIRIKQTFAYWKDICKSVKGGNGK